MFVVIGRLRCDFDAARNHLKVGYADSDASANNDDAEVNHIVKGGKASEGAISTDKKDNGVESTSSWTRLYRERPDYTGFSRSFAFQDPMDVEKASALMENGVLTLTIPKLVGKKTACITIR
ncbi:hypothetical protein CXG81DRAFT_28915 [Caulochytrium protostelioides]|uniref:SHSP domain-containing protein n=1 Tax=Caulochytrium protostelioides TaxID=1555241 RepID=A0A4P9WXV4_9FUNG|nr:hypothetical protein CXG81DRAFT_28915 [Caulochytrium protostelioides]|eukprot:RKO98254.1 hypothetical protein CXG81DRAFT_28915 [Caulochytrium protostelioides]